MWKFFIKKKINRLKNFLVNLNLLYYWCIPHSTFLSNFHLQSFLLVTIYESLFFLWELFFIYVNLFVLSESFWISSYCENLFESHLFICENLFPFIWKKNQLICKKKFRVITFFEGAILNYLHVLKCVFWGSNYFNLLIHGCWLVRLLPYAFMAAD